MNYKSMDLDNSNANEGQYSRLFSFAGERTNKEITNIVFTLYNEKYYLFIVISNECSHCGDIFKTPNTQWQLVEKYDNLEFFILSSSVPQSMAVVAAGKFQFLLVDERDLFQFGQEFPVFYFANGKGDIIFKQIGYSSDLPAAISSLYERCYFRKSEIIRD